MPLIHVAFSDETGSYGPVVIRAENFFVKDNRLYLKLRQIRIDVTNNNVYEVYDFKSMKLRRVSGTSKVRIPTRVLIEVGL